MTSLLSVMDNSALVNRARCLGGPGLSDAI